MTAREQAARWLADRHFEIEPGIQRIFTLRDAARKDPSFDSPIMLLEVSETTPPAGILPLSFGPAPSVPFPSVILEVTPEEFDQIVARTLLLPDGWSIDAELPKPNGR